MTQGKHGSVHVNKPIAIYVVRKKKFIVRFWEFMFKSESTGISHSHCSSVIVERNLLRYECPQTRRFSFKAAHLGRSGRQVGVVQERDAPTEGGLLPCIVVHT